MMLPTATRLAFNALVVLFSIGHAVAAKEVGKQHCRIVKPAWVTVSDVEWTGPCKDGYADGEGTLIWKSNLRQFFRYEGQLRRGVMHGQGYSQNATGTQYEGGFVDGKREGFGTMLVYDGSEYKGQWKAGEQHGQGSYVTEQGARYDGEWKENLFDGLGRVVYVGGEIVEGEFTKGNPVQSAPRPFVAESKSYGLRDQRSTHPLRPEIIQMATLPLDRPYHEMSNSQRESIRASYTFLSEADEPPFPQAGMAKMTQAIYDIQQRARLAGPLIVYAHIDANGKAQSVKTYASPHPEMTKAAAIILMNEKYKPGLCAGKPCALDFKMQFDFETYQEE